MVEALSVAWSCSYSIVVFIILFEAGCEGPAVDFGGNLRISSYQNWEEKQLSNLLRDDDILTMLWLRVS